MKAAGVLCKRLYVSAPRRDTFGDSLNFHGENSCPRSFGTVLLPARCQKRSIRQNLSYRGGIMRRQGTVRRRLLLERLENRVLPSFVAPLAYDVGTRPASVAV